MGKGQNAAGVRGPASGSAAGIEVNREPHPAGGGAGRLS